MHRILSCASLEALKRGRRLGYTYPSLRVTYVTTYVRVAGWGGAQQRAVRPARAGTRTRRGRQLPRAPQNKAQTPHTISAATGTVGLCAHPPLLNPYFSPGARVTVSGEEAAHGRCCAPTAWQPSVSPRTEMADHRPLAVSGRTRSCYPPRSLSCPHEEDTVHLHSSIRCSRNHPYPTCKKGRDEGKRRERPHGRRAVQGPVGSPL